MTPQQIVGLAVRLFAIWLAITTLQFFGMEFTFKSNQGILYISALLCIVVVLLLWFFPMSIAHKLVPRTKFDNTLELPAQQVVVVACVVLGLFLIVCKALPSITAYLALAAIWIAKGQQVSTLSARAHIDGFIGFIQIVVGLFLVTKAHVLAAKIMLVSNTATTTSTSDS